MVAVGKEFTVTETVPLAKLLHPNAFVAITL